MRRTRLPTLDDTATDEDADAFEESDGWAHGVHHAHIGDMFFVQSATEEANRG